MMTNIFNAEPENTGQKQGGKFQPGQSGNPVGRPKGSRNKTTLAAQAMLDGDAEAICRKVIELARDGDITAIRLVLERILPPRKDYPIALDLSSLRTAQDIQEAIPKVIEAMGNGDITPSEAQMVSGLLESFENLLKKIESGQEFERVFGKSKCLI